MAGIADHYTTATPTADQAEEFIARVAVLAEAWKEDILTEAEFRELVARLLTEETINPVPLWERDDIVVPLD